MSRIKVDLDKRSYPIIIGNNIPDKLVKQLEKRVRDNRLFVLFDSNVYALYGKGLLRILKKFNPVELVVPAGEKSKNPNEALRIQSFLLSEQIKRSDFILAVGGGVISDLAGYAAATVLRGVSWGVIATSLLAMVDAAIGGKTGVNHTRGKNLIGAFWQPSFVFSDTSYLETLPDRELICGLGEVLKYAGLAGGDFEKLLRLYIDKERLFVERSLRKLIRASAAYKAEIVSRDEREGKLRMLLNFGHTIGHAVENAVGYGKLRHGEAVILGLWASCYLSLSVRSTHLPKTAEYQELVEQFIRFIPYCRVNRTKLLSAMKMDKKRSSHAQKFILLDRPGKPIITDAVGSKAIVDAVDAMLDKFRQAGMRL